MLEVFLCIVCGLIIFAMGIAVTPLFYCPKQKREFSDLYKKIVELLKNEDDWYRDNHWIDGGVYWYNQECQVKINQPFYKGVRIQNIEMALTYDELWDLSFRLKEMIARKEEKINQKFLERQKEVLEVFTKSKEST